MTSFSLAVKRSAQKDLDTLDDAVFRRVDAKILALADDPRPPGCGKLAGYANQWRIRIGDYRVIYTIDDAQRHIHIVRVAHRREVYEP